MTKRILDEETRKQLLSYLPFSCEARIDFTPKKCAGIKDTEFRPIFQVRSMKEAEVRQYQKNTFGYFKDNLTREESASVSDKNEQIMQGCILGWTNLYDVGTGEEIAYDPKAYGRLPQYMRNELMEFILQISGLSLMESLSLK